MKKTGLLVIILLLVACNSKQKENQTFDNNLKEDTVKFYKSKQLIKNDLLKLNLKGKVLAFNEFTYCVDTTSGNIKKKNCVLDLNYTNHHNNKGEVYFFNEEGNLRQICYFDLDSILVDVKIIKYNLDGLKTEENNYSPNNKKLIKKIIYRYDGNKLVEESNCKPSGEVISKLVYKHDEQNNIIEKSLVSYTGEVVTTNYYKYDKNGNLYEESYQSANLNSRLRYTYNFDKKGNLTYKSCKSIQDKGHIVGKDKKESSSNYKYDQNGNIIEFISINSNNESEKTTYNYDDKNNLISEEFYNSDNILVSKIEYNYEYDDKGNWIKKIKFYNGKPKQILERVNYY